MSTRVHELAKELGLKSPELLDRIQKAGLDVKASAPCGRRAGHGGSDQADDQGDVRDGCTPRRTRLAEPPRLPRRRPPSFPPPRRNVRRPVRQPPLPLLRHRSPPRRHRLRRPPRPRSRPALRPRAAQVPADSARTTSRRSRPRCVARGRAVAASIGRLDGQSRAARPLSGSAPSARPGGGGLTAPPRSGPLSGHTGITRGTGAGPLSRNPGGAPSAPTAAPPFGRRAAAESDLSAPFATQRLSLSDGFARADRERSSARWPLHKSAPGQAFERWWSRRPAPRRRRASAPGRSATAPGFVLDRLGPSASQAGKSSPERPRSQEPATRHEIHAGRSSWRCAGPANLTAAVPLRPLRAVPVRRRGLDRAPVDPDPAAWAPGKGRPPEGRRVVVPPRLDCDVLPRRAEVPIFPARRAWGRP